MLAALVSLALVATAASPLRVVCPGFTAQGVTPAAASAMLDRFATELGRDPGLKVITEHDIQQMLGVERQRQLLGCDDAAAECMAELTSALGADVIVSGSLVKVGTRITATVRALRMPGADVLLSESTRADNEDALSDWLDARALELRSRLGAPPAGAAGSTRWAPWLVSGLGVVAAGVGVGLFALSKAEASQLANADGSLDIDAVVAAGRLHESLGLGLIAGGAVALAAGLLWRFVFGAEPASSVQVVLGPFGGALAGTWP